MKIDTDCNIFDHTSINTCSLLLQTLTESTSIATNVVRVHLYYSECESESDVASDLLHCFQSVCLYYSDV